MTDQTQATTEKRITFEELVAHGISSGGNVVRGMPWSFSYEGHPVTHENDDLYLVTPPSGTVRFHRGEVLVTASGGRVFTEVSERELKVWPQHADALESGAKTFEFRKDDRDPRYAVGDVLRLREYVPEPCREFDAETNTCLWGNLCEGEDGHYTGREWRRRVTYVARGGVIPEGYCCMSIEPVPSPCAGRGLKGLPTWEELEANLSNARWHPLATNRAATLDALEAQVRTLLSAAEQGERDREDAERWRGLFGCDRVRVLGTGGTNHIGVEFWVRFPLDPAVSESTGASRVTLAEFADRAARQPRQEGA